MIQFLSGKETSDLKKERLTNDVRYQDVNEITLDGFVFYNEVKGYLISGVKIIGAVRPAGGAFLLPVDKVPRGMIKSSETGGEIMAQPIQTRSGLTGNQLKILAMFTMTCDHVGMQLFPQAFWLRLIGRLAMPIYAYMIAEGCRHTRDRKKYLLRLLGMGALCQGVYFVAMGSLYMCILITFSLSVILICAADSVKTGAVWRVFGGTTAGVFFLCTILPDLIPGFEIDYGLPGVLLPVFIYEGGTRGLLMGLALVALKYGGIQWLAFGAVPLLLLYNGQRGKANIGKLFYWYYPIHLVVIYGISLIV